MKKKNLLLVVSLFTGMVLQAQILKVLNGTDFTITSGTAVYADSLVLTPTADFILTNNTLSESQTVLPAHPYPAGKQYISRVYQFSNNFLHNFSGSLQIYYADNELNGITENELMLSIHDGTAWTAYPPASSDATNNFVRTNGLNNLSNMIELTLGNSSALPLEWLSFTATKQNRTALIQWATAQEQNTRNFTVQHSNNGIDWAALNTLPAAGKSLNSYNYVHNNPAAGINYYRLLQTDRDNRSSYSGMKMLKFTGDDESFVITGNPVTNGVLIVQVHTATVLSLYNGDGKLMWQEHVNTGTKQVDVSRFATGTYLLKGTHATLKVMIQ